MFEFIFKGNKMSIENKSEFLIYQTDDGQTKIDVRVENETVWLTQMQMTELFQTTKQNISLHINNVFKEGELDPNASVKKYLTVQNEGNRRVSREIDHYNLDVIISVGYRVKSHRGTQFRIWATQRLREYIIKGFTMNDDLLKKSGGGNYLKSSCSASEIYVPVRRYFTVRCWKSMQRALTTTRGQRQHRNFSKRYRIKCNIPLMEKLLQKLYMSVQMGINLIWG
jgi:hypothetical protein